MTNFQVGTLIALLAEDGEDWKEVAKEEVSETESTPSSASTPAPEAEKEEVVSQPTGGSTPGMEINMPSLSPTMTEGTIVKWMKKVRQCYILVIMYNHIII